MKLRLVTLSFAVLTSSVALAQTADPAAATTPTPGTPASTGTPATGVKPPASQTEVSQAQSTTAPETKPKSEVSKLMAWAEKVKVSGKAYTRYSFELTEAAHGKNEFNLDRLYLQTEFTPVEKVRFQVTFDAGDTRNGGTGVFLAETKYAFGEYKDFLPGLYVRGGLIPLAWIPYEEDIWGYRVQGAMPVDRWGYQTSSDLGVSVGGTLPSKFGSFQLNVNNGEGYKSIELLKRKELQGRLTINPLASMGGLAAGIFVTGYGSYGFYDDSGLVNRNRVRAIGQVGIQTAPFTVAGEYVFTRDTNPKVKNRFVVGPEGVVNGSIIAVYGSLKVGQLAAAASGLELFARYDAVDPDDKLADNNFWMIVGGAAWKFNDNVKLLADYEGVTYGEAAGGAAKNESRIKIHGEFKF